MIKITRRTKQLYGKYASNNTIADRIESNDKSPSVFPSE